jgi:ABC-type multidrug transport system ATPase subunit
VIEAVKVAKSFGDKLLFDDLNFMLPPNGIVGVIGPNGAGKTTLIRLILGLINADGGNSQILGEIPTPKNSSVLRKVGIILENDGFNGNLTFCENLEFFAKIKNIKNHELQKYIDENYEEFGVRKIAVKLFSKGERMQCAIARAFLGAPKIVILDEPTTGLDYKQCNKFFKIVKNSQKTGTAILVSSHNLFAVDNLCTKIIELKDGEISEISKDFFKEKIKYE